MIVVADTSPVTALLHLGQLELLKHLYRQVYIPAAVADELQTLTAFGYDISFLNNDASFIVKATTVDIAGSYSQLDMGEAAAIALAIELQADLYQFKISSTVFVVG